MHSNYPTEALKPAVSYRVGGMAALSAAEDDNMPGGSAAMAAPRLRKGVRLGGLVALSVSLCCGAPGAFVEDTAKANAGSAAASAERTLDDCIATALQNNHRRPVSRFAVAAAEAQLGQALSSYWPQVTAAGGYQRVDQAPNFVFPASVMGVPAQTITTAPSVALITVPAGVLGPTALQLPVSLPAQTVSTPAQALPVPAQTIKLLNPDSAMASASFTWLLYDGGLRQGLRQQGEAAVAAMKQEARRTDLEVIDSVKRMYFGAVLARQLHQLGRDTLGRMEGTLQVTDSLYKGGGGKVTKADFLDNTVTAESIRAMVATLEKNEAMAEAALANTMGLPWQASITPTATEIPFAPAGANLDRLVSDAYEFSPDWKRVEAGLNAAEGALTQARSGHAPKIALTGNLHRWWNSYDAGMATPDNKEGWTLGVGFELPVFDGFLTRHRIAEARARLEQLKQQRLLLREGIGLQIKAVFLSLAETEKAFTATQAAQLAAEQNRELNVRAYASELVETEKVIRAQLMEALMTAQALKVRYDHATLQSQLALLVGTEIERQLGPPR